ncbi:hypothetical protein ACFPRL_31195 [Pseudoclavibacter helvolus]
MPARSTSMSSMTRSPGCAVRSSANSWSQADSTSESRTTTRRATRLTAARAASTSTARQADLPVRGPPITTNAPNAVSSRAGDCRLASVSSSTPNATPVPSEASSASLICGGSAGSQGRPGEA